MNLVDIAESGDLSELERRLDAGGDIDERDDDGRVALHAALAEGHRELAILLLERGANPHALDSKGRGLLHWAAYSNDREILEIARLAAGASVDVEDATGETPLTLAAHDNSCVAIAWLLEHGADPNHVSFNGWAGLHHAAASGHLDAVRLLLEGGAKAMLRLPPPPGDTFGHLASDLARYYQPNRDELLSLLDAAETAEDAAD